MFAGRIAGRVQPSDPIDHPPRLHHTIPRLWVRAAGTSRLDVRQSGFCPIVWVSFSAACPIRCLASVDDVILQAGYRLSALPGSRWSGADAAAGTQPGVRRPAVPAAPPSPSAALAKYSTPSESDGSPATGTTIALGCRYQATTPCASTHETRSAQSLAA